MSCHALPISRCPTTGSSNTGGGWCRRREVECWRSGSGREACEALGWKLCRPYLLKVCDAAKITLRKEKEETGEVRYFGRRRAVRAKAQPKVQEAADGQK